eukprot:612531-Amorphochlora_amoeboformis.AAC.1
MCRFAPSSGHAIPPPPGPLFERTYSPSKSSVSIVYYFRKCGEFFVNVGCAVGPARPSTTSDIKRRCAARSVLQIKVARL